jgi:hypothetical protein
MTLTLTSSRVFLLAFALGALTGGASLFAIAAAMDWRRWGGRR